MSSLSDERRGLQGEYRLALPRADVEGGRLPSKQVNERMFAMSNITTEQQQKFEHSYRAFSLGFGKVAAVFLFGGALLVLLFDAALASIALLLDLLGHPNNVSGGIRSMFSSPLGMWMVAVAYLFLLIPQFISALFA